MFFRTSGERPSELSLSLYEISLFDRIAFAIFGQRRVAECQRATFDFICEVAVASPESGDCAEQFGILALLSSLPYDRKEEFSLGKLTHGQLP